MQGCAAQKGGPDAPVDAKALGVQAEAQHRVRRGGQKFGEQARRQGGREVDHMPRRVLPADASSQAQQLRDSGPPVPIQRGHEFRAGQRPGRLHMTQQRQGGGEIVQTDQTHLVTAVVQILNKGLTLQQVAKAGQVEKQNVCAHAAPSSRVRPERCVRRRPACSGPGFFPAGSGSVPPPAPLRWKSRTVRRAACRHC